QDHPDYQRGRRGGEVHHRRQPGRGHEPERPEGPADRCGSAAPSLTRYFARGGPGGIGRLLKESCRPDEAVQRSFVDNLDLLLCHDVPGNPSELLGSDRMLKVIEHYKNQYEAVVIDSPVVISVPDT